MDPLLVMYKKKICRTLNSFAVSLNFFFFFCLSCTFFLSTFRKLQPASAGNRFHQKVYKSRRAHRREHRSWLTRSAFKRTLIIWIWRCLIWYRRRKQFILVGSGWKSGFRSYFCTCNAAKKSDLKDIIMQKLEKSCSKVTQWAECCSGARGKEEKFIHAGCFLLLNVLAAACKQE